MAALDGDASATEDAMTTIAHLTLYVLVLYGAVNLAWVWRRRRAERRRRWAMSIAAAEETVRIWDAAVAEVSPAADSIDRKEPHT